MANGTGTPAGELTYASLGEVKEYIGITGSEHDEMLTAMIAAACAVIDHLCRRTFKAPPVEETRLFDGRGGSLLLIDDAQSVSGVKLDLDGDGVREYDLDSSYYVLGPRNKLPKLWVELLPSSPVDFPKTPASVEITGLWGYGYEVPQPVKEACKLMVARAFKRKDTAFATQLASPEMGGFRVERQVDPDVIQMLKPYRRTRLRILVP